MAFFSKIKEGLRKTSDSINQQINVALSTFHKLDEDAIEELFEAMVLADMGPVTAEKVCDKLRSRGKLEKIETSEELKKLLAEILIEEMGENQPINTEHSPTVILVIGVNGAGKTTTIGKLAHRYKQEGKKVLLCAADTFRAAAVDQLKVWAERADVEIIAQKEGADPAAVVFDGMKAAKARNSDVIICDTAGRLQNKQNLMQELAKISRVIDRELPDAHRETILVLDATTGQNATHQANEFNKVAEISGIALTKLDGTAKGGIAIAITSGYNIPVKLIGVGEKIDDLIDFDTREFVEALLSE